MYEDFNPSSQRKISVKNEADINAIIKVLSLTVSYNEIEFYDHQ